MSKHNEAPPIAVCLADIRAIYDHLPVEGATSSRMAHPAILVYAHDPENAANAAGQIFLERNNNPTTRASQPLAVAAEMIGADYKIFDLTPPERQGTPASENDLALAISYGMVTIEQGVDFVALYALGQETEKLLPQINTLNDVVRLGAMNIAACYGAWLASRMAGMASVASASLAACLTRMAESENVTALLATETDDLTEFSLALIRRKALASIV